MISCKGLIFITALTSCWALLSFSAIFLERPAFLQLFFRNSVNHNDSNAARQVYIPGAGFSGFFYTLGRLYSLRNVTDGDDTYYCFSAGCLALVATLVDVSLESVVEMAHASRNKWMRGEIGRYQVVEYFVDRLLENDDREEFKHEPNTMINATATLHHHLRAITPHKLQRHLSKINIITSKWTKDTILTQSIRTPSSLLELKQMLLQTTYIPFVTGPSLGSMDQFGNTHNDGAFASLLYGWKRFSKDSHRADDAEQYYELKLPWDVDLLYNGLNIVLDYDKAMLFWRRGLLRG